MQSRASKVAAVGLVAAIATLFVLLPPSPGRASCESPTTCWVQEARVVGCEVIDAAQQP